MRMARKQKMIARGEARRDQREIDIANQRAATRADVASRTLPSGRRLTKKESSYAAAHPELTPEKVLEWSEGQRKADAKSLFARNKPGLIAQANKARAEAGLDPLPEDGKGAATAGTTTRPLIPTVPAQPQQLRRNGQGPSTPPGLLDRQQGAVQVTQPPTLPAGSVAPLAAGQALAAGTAVGAPGAAAVGAPGAAAVAKEFQDRRAKINDNDVDSRYQLARWLYDNKAYQLANNETMLMRAQFPTDGRVKTLLEVSGNQLKDELEQARWAEETGQPGAPGAAVGAPGAAAGGVPGAAAAVPAPTLPPTPGQAMDQRGNLMNEALQPGGVPWHAVQGLGGDLMANAEQIRAGGGTVDWTGYATQQQAPAVQGEEPLARAQRLTESLQRGEAQGSLSRARRVPEEGSLGVTGEQLAAQREQFAESQDQARRARIEGRPLSEIVARDEGEKAKTRERQHELETKRVETEARVDVAKIVAEAQGVSAKAKERGTALIAMSQNWNTATQQKYARQVDSAKLWYKQAGDMGKEIRDLQTTIATWETAALTARTPEEQAARSGLTAKIAQKKQDIKDLRKDQDDLYGRADDLFFDMQQADEGQDRPTVERVEPARSIPFYTQYPGAPGAVPGAGPGGVTTPTTAAQPVAAPAGEPAAGQFPPGVNTQEQAVAWVNTQIRDLEGKIQRSGRLRARRGLATVPEHAGQVKELEHWKRTLRRQQDFPEYWKESFTTDYEKGGGAARYAPGEPQPTATPPAAPPAYGEPGSVQGPPATATPTAAPSAAPAARSWPGIRSAEHGKIYMLSNGKSGRFNQQTKQLEPIK